MSDIAKSKELLKRYSIARIPFISVNTIEPGRALDALKEIADSFLCAYSDERRLRYFNGQSTE